MKDKRKHERVTLNGADSNGRMLSARYVKVLDISITGVSFEADRRLDLGQGYTLQLRSDGKGMTLRGIIVWSSVIGNKGDEKGNVIPIYRAGMKFTMVSPEVENFIELKKRETNEGETTGEYDFDIECLDLPEKEREKLESFVNSIYG
jgi:hypothetical protein